MRIALLLLLAACTTTVEVTAKPGAVAIKSEAGWCGSEVTITPTQVAEVPGPTITKLVPIVLWLS
jgi:hypothetical protein